MADVVLPAAAAWAETDGTVTNSERRVQRVRKALDPPGDALDDIAIIAEIAKRMGHDWGDVSAESLWDECRSLSPMHTGMRYDRIEELGGMLAVAVTATMYGTVLANAIAGPIGDKLSLRSGEEILAKEMMLQGIMSIQAGDNPRTTTEKMLAFVPQSGRSSLKFAA